MAIVSEVEVRGGGVRRQLRGWDCVLDDGRKLYMARRRHAEIFRGGKTSISSAMTQEIAAWAIDEDLLINLRAKGVPLIGVRVIDTGDIYLTRLSVFFDRKTYKLKDYTGVGRGGSRQRYVALQHWALKKAAVEIEHSKLY